MADQVSVAPDWVSVAELDNVVMAVPVTAVWLPGLATATVLVTVQVNVAVPKKPAPSAALMVTEQVHGAVGVPVMVPVEALIESPAGRPVADQVSVAPDCVSVAELDSAPMAVPVRALWLPGLVTDTELEMVQVNEAVPDWLAPSVAVRTTEQVHGAVGVPVMVPTDELIESPAGRPEADQVSVAPDWESLAEFVTGEMAVPVRFEWGPGLATDTVLVTVQVMAAVPKNPPPSVALMVTEHEHGAVGVPVTDPVDELIESPEGRPVADQVRVAADWESVAELDSGVMAVPVTDDVLPGLATDTVLVTVQVMAVVPK